MGTLEIDLTYAISEIQDIQSELSEKDAALTDLASRLEVVEARLKEVTDTLLTFFSAATTPGHFFAASQAYRRLAEPLPPQE